MCIRDSYDGAEVCELVGIYLLKHMKDKFKSLVLGLYRDDGLGFCKTESGSSMERTKKGIIKFFKDNGLQITIETNLKQVNFLDVTLDLPSGKFWPYQKENNSLLYINKLSNHPPNITKQLPTMIQDRVSSLSCSRDEFDKNKDPYNEALAKSGFSETIQYSPTVGTSAKKKQTRSRKVIWFNPPYNSAVSTNIGHKFLRLIAKHFPQEHKYAKIFNKNSVKVSYSCMPKSVA